MDNVKERMVAKLHEQNVITDQLQILEQKTGIKREYFAFGGLLIVGFFLLFGYASSLLCNLIGFLYPAYQSIKAIESNAKDDDKQWLTYWVVYAFFSVVEYFSDIFLFWFPFYYVGKCLFLMWCMAPMQWNGSTMLYTKVIRPFFLKHEAQMDSMVNNLTETIQREVPSAMNTVLGQVAGHGQTTD